MASVSMFVDLGRVTGALKGAWVNSGPHHGISLWTAILTTLISMYVAFGPVQDSSRESRIKLYVRRGLGWVFFILGLIFLLGLAMARTTYLP
jgi:hypothetical protein